MVRTQVYLLEEQKRGLERAAEATGRKQSELIREGVDLFLRQDAGSGVPDRKLEALRQLHGMWKDRDDLPDFDELRRSADRDPWGRDPLRS